MDLIAKAQNTESNDQVLPSFDGIDFEVAPASKSVVTKDDPLPSAVEETDRLSVEDLNTDKEAKEDTEQKYLIGDRVKVVVAEKKKDFVGRTGTVSSVVQKNGKVKIQFDDSKKPSNRMIQNIVKIDSAEPQLSPRAENSDIAPRDEKEDN